jgi:hypothetical protein
MFGRVYSVSFAATSVSTAVDLFELDPGINRTIQLVGLMLSQVGNSDVGDAQEEILRFQILRGFENAAGGAGFAPVPIAREGSDAAFTCRIVSTTLAGGGSLQILHEDGFNVRSGYQMWWPQGCGPSARSGGAGFVNRRMVIRLPTAPADAITLSGTLYVAEMV